MSKKDWSDTGWFLNVKGSRDLFAKIGSIGGYSSRARFAWRGISSSDFELVSSLQRSHPRASEDTLRAKERLTIEAARDWGLGFGAGGWSSDLQLLADLQHYGTSTRLLDVTSNPMTALWFACQSPNQLSDKRKLSEDGLLVAINTVHWKRYGRSAPAVSYSAVQNPLSWELDEALHEGEPFVVESLIPNDRLRAQEGFFIASRVPEPEERFGPFKNLVLPFEPTTSSKLEYQLTHSRPVGRSSDEQLPFVAILVPGQLKNRILQRLENSYNRTARVLFPDFSGFREFSKAGEVRRPTNDNKLLTSAMSELGENF